jgi:hypothetical protein
MKPKPTPAEWLAEYNRWVTTEGIQPKRLLRLIAGARAIIDEIAETHPPMRTER